MLYILVRDLMVYILMRDHEIPYAIHTVERSCVVHTG